MAQSPQLTEQNMEQDDTGQSCAKPHLAPVKRRFRIFPKLVLAVGILGEIYMMLFGLAGYLVDTPGYGQYAGFVIYLIGLEGVWGNFYVSPKDGFRYVMHLFRIFFIGIPTLRFINISCLVYSFFRGVWILCDDNSINKRIIRWLMLFYVLWILYYIGMFWCFSICPIRTIYTWPFTPFLNCVH